MPTAKELLELGVGTCLTALAFKLTMRAGAQGAAASVTAIMLVNAMYREAAEKRELKPENAKFKAELKACEEKYGPPSRTLSRPDFWDSR